MIELVIKNQLEKALSAPAYYGDPNKLDFIYSELAFGQLFFVAYSSEQADARDLKSRGG
ncbi:hypothetical protein [Aerococcus tenax]